ncbi:hypothetical protein BDV28DRAFT_148046 [Aspergillus coremiiformis]|uniref:Uncharacterized protein n=1 Tax=Aspergillus coremiiformis TaxID=138285 RepID=A0A5N6Z718_9EURO|nr:hypothetical protein BDV28DRAFT_148046 [Aspergillus coremiiformis]
MDPVGLSVLPKAYYCITFRREDHHSVPIADISLRGEYYLKGWKEGTRAAALVYLLHPADKKTTNECYFQVHGVFYKPKPNGVVYHKWEVDSTWDYYVKATLTEGMRYKFEHVPEDQEPQRQKSF